MLNISRTALACVATKWIIALLLTAAALWTVWVAPGWEAFPDNWLPAAAMFLAALVVHLLEKEAWMWLSRRLRIPVFILRILIPVVLTIITTLLTPPELAGYGLVAGVFFALNLALLLLGLLLKDRSRENLVNLAVVAASLFVMLLVAEFLITPIAADAVANARRQAAITAVTAPLDQSDMPDADNQPQTTEANPLGEFIERGPGPEWGELTGWGTNTDTILRWRLEGEYDVLVEYNGLGFRGPEIPYEKPDDVYRILMVGDSFIEAREVDYAETVYAQLGQMLADSRTADGRRIEVFGLGATGWGTLQAYLYYHHEGARFDPDMVIHFFFINDVADNHPAFFYSDRDIDFVVGEDGVQIIRDGVAPEEQTVNPGARWLDALPPVLSDTATIGLIRQVINPPREVVTLAGTLAQVHPQNYIFVHQPEIDGYAEGWRRTQRAYEIWTAEAESNGAELMVLAIDISLERITELATYFSEEQDGWLWDVDLPYKRLAETLDPLGVPLVLTREYYAAFAETLGERPYDALFIPGDGHWNADGHRATAQLLADTLREIGITQE